MFGIGFWEIVIIVVMLGVLFLGAVVVLAVTLTVTRPKGRAQCRVCSRPVDASDNFCRHCGAKLQPQAGALDSESQSFSPP